MSDLALPSGTRLLHIGPHKTGTTAIQLALHQHRDELERRGIHYAWSTSQAYRPAIGLVGGGQRGSEPGDPAHWSAFVDEVSAAGDRTVVASSESFSNATPEHIARIRDDLGPRLHVVRMVRRYDKLMSSQWQQRIAGGAKMTFDSYLSRAFSEPDHQFWRRHGFARQTQRWVDVLGAERVSVVVVKESDPLWLLRVMEQMLSLPPSSLKATADPANRSLTLAETDTMRHLSIDIRELGWAPTAHFSYVRHGAAKGFRSLPPDSADGRLQLPAEAVRHLAAVTREHVADLHDLGVRVVGDTDWLTIPPDAAATDTNVPQRPTLSVASAARGAAAIVRRGQQVDKRIRLHDPEVGEPNRTLAMVASASAALTAQRSGPTTDGDFTVLPPWVDWALGWQIHLLGRGQTDFDTWVSDHLHEQAERLEDWRGTSRGRARIADPPDIIDWASAQLVAELVNIGHSEEWSDHTWMESVDRGIAATLLTPDTALTPVAPWISATSQAAAEAAPRLLAALPRLRRPAARGRLLPTAGDIAPTGRIDTRRAADAFLGAMAAFDLGNADHG